MQRTTERQAHFAAWFAVAQMGGTFYSTRADVLAFAQDSPHLLGALVTDYETAQSVEAYLIERPYGDRGHQWRLNKLLKGGGQSDVGKMFPTAGAFFDAMRTLEDMARAQNVLERMGFPKGCRAKKGRKK